MADWFDEATAGDVPLLRQVALRILVAALIGAWVAAVYLRSRRRTLDEARPFATTLVLLTALLALTTGVIGNSVARAFGLVGALSIVRFRTVVEDTRDTAFVIFAVVAGMAAGTGQYAHALLGAGLVGALALLLSLGAPAASGAPGPRRRLLVRVATGRDPEALVRGCLERRGVRAHILSAATARQGAAFEATFAVELRDEAAALALVQELAALEGLQHVELEPA